MPPSSGGFTVQPTSLDYVARLLEDIAAEFERLSGSFASAFETARGGAGEPDLERCLGLAALDFNEFARAIAAAAYEEAHKLRVASLEYVATDRDAAAGFGLAATPETAAGTPNTGTPDSLTPPFVSGGGPR